ncbi:hypothetical protein ACTFIY_000013 [Dictyostelium cf. discoideum]
MKLLEIYDKQLVEQEEGGFRAILTRYLNKWIFTVDHKLIGTMYITFSIFAGIIGTLLSLVIRMELSTGNMLEGDSQQYNVITKCRELRRLLKKTSKGCFEERTLVCSNIKKIGQSAGNQTKANLGVGSSETIRETLKKI